MTPIKVVLVEDSVVALEVLERLLNSSPEIDVVGTARDGAEGLRVMRRAGAIGIVQDKESAIIAGMPVAALNHAGADHVVALSNVADTITAAVAFIQRSPVARDRVPVRKVPDLC